MTKGKRRRPRRTPPGARVPVPGLPLWVGHAELEPRAGNTVKFSPRVRVHPVRYAAWRVGCRVTYATAAFWHSLYERTDGAEVAPSVQRKAVDHGGL